VSTPIEISVVVCTRNRAASLEAALTSLARQTLAPARYEVIVVDNGSTDETPRLARAAGVRALVEPRVGLSRARNRGTEAAAGEIIAFLDDDAVAREDWLARIAAGFAAGDAGALTGRVEPLWEAPRPDWLPDVLLPYLSVVDWGARAGALHPGQWLCGTNMAFRRAALARAGGFSEALGRRGDVLLSSEEVLVQRRLAAHGIAARYDPSLVVDHRVPAERVAPAWLARRAYWQGVSNAICDRLAPGVLDARPWLRCAASGVTLVATSWRLASRGTRGVAGRCKALLRAGYVLGWTGLVTGPALRSPVPSRTLGA
jgi:glycosyltransferase involved in cell wall biosynthesis